MGNNDRVVFNPVNTVKFWSQKVLPLVYDESLSYYEVLAKLRAKLNEVIEELNKVPDLILQTIRDFIKTEEFELVIKGYIEKYALTKVWHDESLTGTGWNDDPLKINIQHDDSIIGKGVIDDLLMINVKHDTSLTGTGVSENPLAIDVKHNETLTGTGTDVDPLSIEVKGGSSITGTGTDSDKLEINVVHDTSLTGKGVSENPLAIDVKHNETLTGTGTDVDPLSIEVKGGSSITGTGTDSDKLEVSIVHDGTLIGIGTEDSPLGVKSDGGGGEGGLDKVYHDETLTGDGTQLNPLSVLQSASKKGIITIVDDYFTESSINENGFINAPGLIGALYNDGVRFFGFKKGKYIVTDADILKLDASNYITLDASIWVSESDTVIEEYTVRLKDTTVASLDAINSVSMDELRFKQQRIIDQPSQYFDSLSVFNDGEYRKLLLANDKTHELTPDSGGGTSGLTQVYHDETLTGQGTESQPLSVVGGGTSGLTEVYHDDTLTGQGTPLQPLSVVGHTNARLWDIDTPIDSTTLDSVLQHMSCSSETTLYIPYPYDEWVWENEGVEAETVRGCGIDLIGITDYYNKLPKLIVPPQEDGTIVRNIFNLERSCTIKNISFTNIRFGFRRTSNETDGTLDIKFENCSFNNCDFGFSSATQLETLVRLTIDKCEFNDSSILLITDHHPKYFVSIKNSYIELNPGSPRVFLEVSMGDFHQCVCDISNNFIVNSSDEETIGADATIGIHATGVVGIRHSVKIHNNVILHGANALTTSITIRNIPNVHITDNRVIYTKATTESGASDIAGADIALIDVSTPENAVIRNNVLIATSLIKPPLYPLRFIRVFGEKIVVSENIVDDETGLGEVIGIQIDSRGSGDDLDIDIDSKDIMILNNYFKGGILQVPVTTDVIDNIMIHGNTMSSISGTSPNDQFVYSGIYDIKFNTFTGSDPIPAELKPDSNLNEIDGQMVGTLVAPE